MAPLPGEQGKKLVKKEGEREGTEGEDMGLAPERVSWVCPP